MPRTGPWTPERDAELREYWAGDLSASQIGAKMALNKNQIIGRAHRLKLPLRGVPTNISRGMVPQPAACVKRELPPKPSFVRAASPSRRPAATSSRVFSFAVERPSSSPRVENLPGAVAEAPPRRVFSHKQCQYITGNDRRDYRFCEAPVVENALGRPSAFCAAHFDLCLVSPKKALEERKAQRAADIEAGRVRWNPPSAWR
jgi:hypothetical protein